MKGTNALAYFSYSSAMEKESFVTLRPVANISNFFESLMLLANKLDHPGWKERLGRDKRSSLFGLLVGHKDKKVLYDRDLWPML